MSGRAVGYVRVSKKDEDSPQNPAGRQVDAIAEWAAENEADVLDWYFDLGVDAAESFSQRSAGAQLLDRVRRGNVTYVVVDNLEILGRGRALLDAVQSLFEAKQGLGIITVLPGPHDGVGADEVGEYRRVLTREPRGLKAA